MTCQWQSECVDLLLCVCIWMSSEQKYLLHAVVFNSEMLISDTHHL